MYFSVELYEELQFHLNMCVKHGGGDDNSLTYFLLTSLFLTYDISISCLYCSTNSRLRNSLTS